MRYGRGWFTGTYEYYDSKLKEHKVNYNLDDGRQTLFHLMTLKVLKLFLNDYKLEVLIIRDF